MSSNIVSTGTGDGVHASHWLHAHRSEATCPIIHAAITETRSPEANHHPASMMNRKVLQAFTVNVLLESA